MVREQKTKSGRLLDVDFTHVRIDGKKIPTRASKSTPSNGQQIKRNQSHAIRRAVRLVNANFNESDYILHPTYSPELAPQSERQARKDVVNYIRRVKTRRAATLKELTGQLAEVKNALDAMPDNKYLISSKRILAKKIKKLKAPFRWLISMEKVTYQTGEYAGRDNWHFHIFISGGLEACEMESIWHSGLRTNCDNFRPSTFGPEAAALYITKDPQGKKRYVHSHNFIEPKTYEPNDGFISAGGLAKIAKQRVDDAAYWERRYPGYKFIRCYSRQNEFNGQWYLSIIMFKCDGDAPPWKCNNWLAG